MGSRSRPGLDIPTMACALLRCPRCQRPLAPAGSALRCPERHTFDIARHGYISLLGGGLARSGDDPEMARARERFLGSGAYARVREAVTGLAVLELRREPVVLDIGAATEALGQVLGRIAYQNLDDLEEFAGVITTTEVMARWVADQLTTAIDTSGLTAVTVLLREHPDAWASYRKALE